MHDFNIVHEQYRSLVMLAECINVHRPFRPKKSSSYEIDYYSHIVQFENRYFHLTETITTDFCKRTCTFTYSDVYEVEQKKYEKIIPVTEYVKKGEKMFSDFEAEISVFVGRVVPHVKDRD